MPECSALTSLTISPVLAGRLPTEPVAGITREGTVEVAAGVDAAVATAVAAGECAAVGRGVDADGRGVPMAVGSDAEGSGLVTVGSDADGNGDPVAIGSEAEGSGRIVAIGRDTVGGARSGGRFGPTAAADPARATHALIAPSTAKTTAAAPRP